MSKKAQVSIEYMVLLGGVIVIATAIYFASKGLLFKGADEINKTHDTVSTEMDNIFDPTQVTG